MSADIPLNDGPSDISLNDEPSDILLNDKPSDNSLNDKASDISLNDKASDISLNVESNISLDVEFSGGLELLFSNQKKHKIALPRNVPSDNSTNETSFMGNETKLADLTYLIHYLRHRLLKERAELFFEKGTVRPGILVLVNDTDWEIEGEGDYVLQKRDQITFISTLHGG